MKIDSTFVDGTNTAEVLGAIRPNTKLIWLETASNPKLQIPDIQEIIKQAKAKNANILITASYWLIKYDYTLYTETKLDYENV